MRLIRNLAGEIADEFAHRQSENLPVDDIMVMVDAVRLLARVILLGMQNSLTHALLLVTRSFHLT